MKKIKSKKFKYQKQAADWAKKEKKKGGPTANIKWETNRTDNPTMPWEAVLYKDVK